VPQLEVGELGTGPAGAGVGGERGDPVAVDVGDPQLRPGCGRSGRMITRIPGGHPDRSSSPIASASWAFSRISPSAS
jgi:hypothetical protein